MDRLSTAKRVQILSALVEGCSLRSKSRMADVSINTVTKLLVDLGLACAKYQDEVMQNLPCKRIQCDEIWSFCYSKQKNVPVDNQGQFGYGEDKTQEQRYSPPKCNGTKRRTVQGSPDGDHISTSYVERANLTMRMGVRRFTRLTNAFSKKVENHAHAIAIHFMHYNFARIHKSLRVTPAMEAGVSDHVWSLEEIIGLLDSN